MIIGKKEISKINYGEFRNDSKLQVPFLAKQSYIHQTFNHITFESYQLVQLEYQIYSFKTIQFISAQRPKKKVLKSFLQRYPMLHLLFLLLLLFLECVW